MAIASIGEFTLDPFDREDASDPIGQMIGVNSLTGDATGGNADLDWILPPSFAYVMLYGSALSTLGVDTVHRYRFVTGKRVNGLDERTGQNLEALNFGSTEETVFIPPKMITLPGLVVPTLTISSINTLGAVFLASFRALVFDRVTVIAQPSRLWRDWIT